MQKIKITYWSDFICPYCYIAEQRMKNLMKELNILDKFEFKLLAFELDPNAPPKRELNIVENFAKKYYMSIEEARNTVNHINDLGKAEGIDFKYDTCNGGNTLKAHKLAKFVEQKGNYEVTEKLIDSLYDAYFTKNLLISDENVLIDLGMKAGCTKEELEKLFNGKDFEKEIRKDEQDAYLEGVHGVPYFMVDGKQVINGAASKGVMKETLLNVLNKKNANQNNAHPEGVYCDENGCYFKKK
jgi:predicted DsbA family dithiol-disulfide isomerase